MTHRTSVPFSVPQARDIIKDLFAHRAGIYWADFLISMTIGYTAAAVYLRSPLFSAAQAAAYLVAGFALFRVGSFIHEIVRMSGRELRAFRASWNILAGIPMLMPSHFYEKHLDHHTSRHYGTGQDGEYLPLGGGPLRNIGYFFAQVLFMPVVVLLRFLVITPLSLMHAGVRRWALERYSSFVINRGYRQEIPAPAARQGASVSARRRRADLSCAGLKPNDPARSQTLTHGRREPAA